MKQQYALANGVQRTKFATSSVSSNLTVGSAPDNLVISFQLPNDENLLSPDLLSASLRQYRNLYEFMGVLDDDYYSAIDGITR